jgi:hypothetical protein
MEAVIGLLLFYFVMWSIGYSMAKTRGRNKVLGVVGWLCFWIFSFIYYWIAGKSEKLIREEKQEDLERLAIIMNAKK